MRKYSLDGEWVLHYCKNTEHPVRTFRESQAEYDRCSASVPGCIEMDLMTAGVLPDLYVGENITKAWELEYGDWWYSKEFTLPSDFFNDVDKDNVFLSFDGIDTISDIYLNGVCVAHVDNMFINHDVPVGQFVKEGTENNLTVHICSALREAEQYDYPALYTAEGYHHESLFIRKAPSMYGWDIMPRLVSGGIWKSVNIVVKDNLRIDDIYVFTKEVTKDSAILRINYQLSETPQRNQFSLRIEMTDPAGDCVFSKNIYPHFKSGIVDLQVEHPKLWWPKGYGEPTLYSLSISILGTNGVVSSENINVGIRKIEVEHKNLPADDGKFAVTVNGCSIFLMGTNWVPLDALHYRDKERLGPALALLGESGCNTVRCWGGNVYESDEFFEWCDQNGVLVWQDFAFACAKYPMDSGFIARVEEEAIKVVKRIRNHPSLLLWSGNNENDYFFVVDGLNPNDDKLSRHVLKSVVFLHDPQRCYVPSSPYLGEAIWHDPKHSSPDQHLWGPRANFKGDFYKHNTAWLISEIGYHGLNAASSLEKFLTSEHMKVDPEDSTWILHETDHTRLGGRRNYSRIQLLLDQAHRMFPEVGLDLNRLVSASQIVQAEALKYFVESARLRAPRCTGIFWWNLLDGWPQISDAVVDYYFNKKLAYYYLKRAQLPLSVVIGESEGWYHPMYILNDSAVNGQVTYEIKNVMTKESIASGALHVEPYTRQKVDQIKVSTDGNRFLSIQWFHDGTSYGSHYLDSEGLMELDNYLHCLQEVSDLYPQISTNTFI